MQAADVHFPFTALVGQEEMKQALLLCLVNPDIGGVLIRGERGTGKSTAVRALAGLVPPIRVVADCPFNCDPEEPALMCAGCQRRRQQGETLPVATVPMPVVTLPLGATEEMVLGTLNIERAVRQGEKAFEPGLLARAHRGFLYVDEVNLLPDHLVDILLDAAAAGINVVEREGISFSHPSKFILVGTMNPDEGELRPQLQDRFALCAQVNGIRDLEARQLVVERRLQFERDPRGFAAAWRQREEELAAHILEARARLPRVRLPGGALGAIARLAVLAEADGHRADIAMAKAALALAALGGSKAVGHQEVAAAARLVLPHRLRPDPGEETNLPEKIEQVLRKILQMDEAALEEARPQGRGKKNSIAAAP